MFLLDTNIVSADAPAKRQVGTEAFGEWVRAHGEQLYISAVTVAEVEAGIARAHRIGATDKAERLRRWMDVVEHFYAGRILPFATEEAREAGTMIDRARAHDPGFEDIAIAATAAVRGFTVLTANERHFAPLGVPFVNPLKELPAL
ncbi:type II toxin-antitoxin system VapC family toxin [Xanthobacter sp. KR7-225]|uniref:type II toxin-antitoxin system VapC family toxin n=1 Tax=Xanthobacter sp. KR7-225 TaxID=3156613 RepID=UPI0032B51BB3